MRIRTSHPSDKGGALRWKRRRWIRAQPSKSRGRICRGWNRGTSGGGGRSLVSGSKLDHFLSDQDTGGTSGGGCGSLVSCGELDHLSDPRVVDNQPERFGSRYATRQLIA